MAVVSLEAAVGAAAFVLVSWVWGQLALRSIALSPPLWPQSMVFREKLMAYFIRVFIGSSTQGDYMKFLRSEGGATAQYRHQSSRTTVPTEPSPLSTAFIKGVAHKGEPLSVWGPVPDSSAPKWSALDGRAQLQTCTSGTGDQNLVVAEQPNACEAQETEVCPGTLAGLTGMALLQHRSRSDRTEECSDCESGSRRAPSHGEPEPEEEEQAEEIQGIKFHPETQKVPGEAEECRSASLSGKADHRPPQTSPSDGKEWEDEEYQSSSSEKEMGNTKSAEEKMVEVAWEPTDYMMNPEEEQNEHHEQFPEKQMVYGEIQQHVEADDATVTNQAMAEVLAFEGIRHRKLPEDQACSKTEDDDQLESEGICFRKLTVDQASSTSVERAQAKATRPEADATFGHPSPPPPQPSAAAAQSFPEEEQDRNVHGLSEEIARNGEEVRSGGEEPNSRSSSNLKCETSGPTSLHTGTVLLPQGDGHTRPAVLLARADPVWIQSSRSCQTSSSEANGEVKGKTQQPCKDISAPQQETAVVAVGKVVKVEMPSCDEPTRADTDEVQRIDILHLVQEKMAEADSEEKMEARRPKKAEKKVDAERPKKTERASSKDQVASQAEKGDKASKKDQAKVRSIVRPPPLTEMGVSAAKTEANWRTSHDSAAWRSEPSSHEEVTWTQSWRSSHDESHWRSELLSQTECAAASFVSASPSPASSSSGSSAFEHSSGSQMSLMSAASHAAVSPASTASSSCWTATSSSGHTGTAALTAAQAQALGRAQNKSGTAAAPWKPSLRLDAGSTSPTSAEPGNQSTYRWSFYR